MVTITQPPCGCGPKVGRTAVQAGAEPRLLLIPDHGCQWWFVLVCEHGNSWWAHPPAEMVERMEEPW